MRWFYLMMDREVIHVPDFNEIQKAVVSIARFL